MKFNSLKSLLAVGLAFAGLTAVSAQDEAYLGVDGYITSVCMSSVIVPTNSSFTKSNGSSHVKGFKLKKVQSDSPAYNAGLKAGDVIIEANGSSISSYSKLRKMRMDLAKYDSIEVFYVRWGKLYSTHVGGTSTSTFTSK